jgi:tetratricopeptide (TPR) repeat protein
VLYNIRDAHGSEDVTMTSSDFIKKALKLQNDEGTASLQAAKLYQKAINAFQPSDDEYDLLYAHYQLMVIYSDLDPDTSVKYAEKCLEILEPSISSGSIFHFTEYGQFQQEVIRYSTNIIGWVGMTQTNDPYELEELLELVSLGVEYADGPQYFYIFDTKVRLLLKLGRNKEAYKIVRKCLREDSTFSDFDDIRKSPEYIEWKRAFESGREVELDAEEKRFLEKAVRILSALKNQVASDAAKKSKGNNELVPGKKIISYAEAKKTYNLTIDREADASVLLFTGDVRVIGNLNDEWFERQLDGMSWQNYLYGMIIDGDLFIEGDLVDDNYMELTVVGNLSCNYIFSENGAISIFGDAQVTYGIYGEYNDGFLEIYGTLKTPYLIADDHSMPRNADGDFIYIEGGNGVERESIGIGKSTGSGWGWGWDYFEDSDKLFSHKVWNEYDEFSVEKFFELVRNGENPFITP